MIQRTLGIRLRPLLGFGLVGWLMMGTAWAGSCDDLGALEKAAAHGELTAEVVTCLEALRSPADPVRSERASNLLIAHAFASHDDGSWAMYVKTHLETIDTADCDLMYRYAMRLLKAGDSRQALKWIEAAAAHSYGWPADALEAKLYELRRLKTKALWALYEQIDEAARMEKRAALGKVQLAAVEWMRAGQKSERDVSEALNFCTRTGWTQERCEQQSAL